MLVHVTSPATYSQVNTETLRVGEDVSGFTGMGEVDLALHKGNTDVFQLGFGGRIDYVSNRNLVFLVGNLRYGERTGAAFLNNGFTHVRFNHDLTGWLIYEAFTQLEYNQFTLLNRRFLLGTGLRAELVNVPDEANVAYGTSYMLEEENRNVPADGPDPQEVVSHRWSNYLTVQFRLTEVLTFMNTAYAQPRFDQLRDIRVLNESSLNIDITAHLTFRTVFNLRYDSRPPAGLVSTDVVLRNAVRVRF